MELYREKKEEIFKLNGIDFTFYVREAKSSDRIKLLATSIRKENGKIIKSLELVYQAKYDIACELITGFPENFPDGNPQFEFKGKAISSDPKSENYNEDWKELILPNFTMQLIVYATKVFEGIDLKDKINSMDKKIEELEQKEMEEESPLESSSLQP